MLKITKLIPKEKLPKWVGKILNTLSVLSPSLGAKGALYLYSKPLKGRLDPQMKEFLNTSDNQTRLKYNNQMDVQVYQWQGIGPTILLLHGWESNASRWRPLIRLLQAEKYNVIAMDAPAHGQSGSTKFSAVLYAEMANRVVNEYKPMCVIGHSVGGMATLYLASHFQNPCIKHLIVMASSNKWLEVASKFHNVLGLNDKIITSFDTVFNGHYNKPQSYYNAEDWAAQLTIPGLVVHDTEDQINLISDGRSIHQNWKNSQYVETTGYGHSMQSREVYRAILDYLKKME
jgi:pimeloyl-ACP methyl ester carboxylesterase